MLAPSPQRSNHDAMDDTLELMEGHVTVLQKIANNNSPLSNTRNDVNAMGTQQSMSQSEDLGSSDWVPPVGLFQQQYILLTILTIAQM